MDGLVVAWMLHHVLKIIKQKIGFIKNLGKHVINMIKNIILNLKNGVIVIFIYLTEKRLEV